MILRRLTIIPIVMSVVLLVSPLIVLADGSGSVTTATPVNISSNEGNIPGGLDQSQSTISLDKAINTVKESFEIPAQLTNFSSDFSSDYSNYMKHQVWILRWMNPQNSPASFEAQVDASTGEIIGMQLFQENNSQGPGLVIPSLTEKDAQNIATDLVTRLAGDKMPELQLQKGSSSILNLNNYGPSVYGFYWQRTINKIPFSSDGISVQINGNNGKVMRYNQNWSNTGAQLPDAQKVISADKAQQLFKSEDILQLQYFQPYPYRLYGNTSDKVQVKLVYGLNNEHVNGAIDALSGESIKSSEGWFNNPKGSLGEGASYSGFMGKGDYIRELSPQEQQNVDNNAKLISQNDAVKAAAQWVSLPDGVVLQNASLSTGWMELNQKVWNLSWGSDNNKSHPEQMICINAIVNAVTGELLNFNYSLPPREKATTGQLNRDEALQVAKSFLQKIQPQRFGQVELMDEDNPASKSYVQDGVQSFCFYRTTNNIPFYNNAINITVDTMNKHIMDYNFNWSDLELPAPDGILSADQANTTYLNLFPLTLSYVQMYKDDKQGDIKLVYVPTAVSDLQTNIGFLDAKSGSLLGWNGQPASEMPKPFYFNDISGNFAEKDITLLGQAGIFGEYGSQFKPDENLSMISFLRALLIAQDSVWSTYLQSDQSILITSRKQGWVSDNIQPSDLVNREMLAQLMINFLKLHKIAQLNDVFKIPYSDTSSFPVGTEGYISLAKALGLFHFDGDKFNPEQPITRSEAAYAIVKALAFTGQRGAK